MKPTLHHPVPIGARVRVPRIENPFGVVAGVASMHIIFHYIVILDIPYEDPDHGPCKAVSCMGTELESEDGKTNWRMTHDEVGRAKL